MKLVLTSVAMVTAIASPAAMAGGLSFGGGVSATSNYLSDGVSESGNGAAVQPFFEVSKNRFYAGVFASNVKDADGNRAALDIYVGYRGETASGLGYDLGYTHHILDRTGAAAGEVSGALDYSLGRRLTLSGEVSYDLSEKIFGGSLGAEYLLSDVWTANAVIGQTDPDVGAFWGAGVAYKFSDRTRIDVQYQDTATTNGLAALTLTYAFGAVEH
jgi:uncharacterized protein (TIGR02001 family)